MADDFQSFKVAANEQSSSSKFDNFVQAVEDAVNSLDNSNIAAAAGILVSKLAAGSNGDVLTVAAGVPTWQPAAASTIPTGAVMPFAGSSAPTGYLLCDGSPVSRNTYSTLFALLGTTYGSGDGVNTFNVPDLQGRVPVGKGSNADVNALNNNDGLAVASRSPKHTHSTTLSGATNMGGTPSTVVLAGAYTSDAKGPAYVVTNYIIKT